MSYLAEKDTGDRSNFMATGRGLGRAFRTHRGLDDQPIKVPSLFNETSQGLRTTPTLPGLTPRAYHKLELKKARRQIERR